MFRAPLTCLLKRRGVVHAVIILLLVLIYITDKRRDDIFHNDLYYERT